LQDQVRLFCGKSHINGREKHCNQLEQILTLLRERGERGATSEELYAIARRFGGRLFEARRAGAVIEVRQLSAGLFLYVLRRDIQTAPTILRREAQSNLTFGKVSG